jgi:hypothetical protein
MTGHTRTSVPRQILPGGAALDGGNAAGALPAGGLRQRCEPVGFCHFAQRRSFFSLN